MDAGVLNYETPITPPRSRIGFAGVALILGVMISAPLGILCFAVAVDRGITLTQRFTPSDIGTVVWLILVGLLLLTPLGAFALGMGRKVDDARS